eukprot:4773825-Amphidinium_carterae.1
MARKEPAILLGLNCMSTGFGGSERFKDTAFVRCGPEGHSYYMYSGGAIAMPQPREPIDSHTNLHDCRTKANKATKAHGMVFEMS